MQMSSTSPERYSCQPATGRRRTSSMRCRVRRCGGPAPSSPPPARLQLVSAAPVRNLHAQLRHVVPSRRSWARVRGVGRWPLARERNGSRTCREGWGPPSSNGLDRLKLDSQVHASSCRRVPHPRGTESERNAETGKGRGIGADYADAGGITVELLQGPRRVRARAPLSSLTSDRGRPRAVWDRDDFASLVGGRR
jgi:hypothetical protein